MSQTIYKNKDGIKLVGVTTIIERLGWNKGALIGWANRIGLEGIKASEFKDDKADIGTLAHAMITSRFVGEIVDTSDYSANQIKQAENSVKSYENWAKTHKIEVAWVEKPLISETYQYGGTPDVYCRNDGKLEIIDLKTGSSIYKEAIIQVVAYYILLKENGLKADILRILNIPRTSDEAFQEIYFSIDDPRINIYWGVFLNCLNIYKAERKLKELGNGINQRRSSRNLKDFTTSPQSQRNA